MEYVWWNGPYVKADIGLLFTQTYDTNVLAYVADRTVLQITAFVSDLMFRFPFWQPAEYILLQKIKTCKDEGSVQASVDFSMLSELCRCYLQQWGLSVSLQRIIYILTIAWVIWKFQQGSFIQQPNQKYSNFDTGRFIC